MGGEGGRTRVMLSFKASFLGFQVIQKNVANFEKRMVTNMDPHQLFNYQEMIFRLIVFELPILKLCQHVQITLKR